MEILKGFVFDIQAHAWANLALAADTTYYLELTTTAPTSVDLGATGWTTTSTGMTADNYVVKVTASTAGTVASVAVAKLTGTDASDAGESYADYTGDLVNTTTDSSGTVTFADASKYNLKLTDVTNGGNYVVTTGFGSGDSVVVKAGATFKANGGTTYTAATGNATFGYAGNKVALTAGKIDISGNSANYTVDVSDGAGTPKVYSIKLVTANAGATIDVGAAAGDAPIVQGLKVGTEVSDATAGFVINTVTTISNGTYTVNGVAYTTDDTDGVTFTAAATGASSVTGLANQKIVSFTNSGTTELTVNTDKYKFVTGVAAVTVSDTGLIKGTVQMDGTTYKTLKVDETTGVGTTDQTIALTGDSAAAKVTKSESGSAAVAVSDVSSGAALSGLVDGTVATVSNATAINLNGAAYTFTSGQAKFSVATSVVTLDTNSVAVVADAVKTAGTTLNAGAGRIAVTAGEVTIAGDGTVTGLTAGDIFTISDITGANTVTYTITSTSSGLQANISGSASEDGDYIISTSASVKAVAAGTGDDILTGFLDANTTTVKLTAGDTIELPKIATGKTVVYHNGDTGAAPSDVQYATLTNSAGTVTFTTQAAASEMAFTVKATNYTSTTLNVNTASTTDPSKIVFETASGAQFTSADTNNAFQITKDTVDADTFTLASGTVELKAATATTYAVTTSAGKLSVYDATAGTEGIKVSSDGAVTKATDNDTVTLNKVDEATSTDTATFSVNGTSFTGYTEKNVTITKKATTGELTVTAGKIAVANGETAYYGTNARKVKVTAGDGVALDSTGLLSNLNNGDVVELVETTGTNTYVYTVLDGRMQITDKATGATVNNALYKLTGDTVSMSAQNTATASEVEAAKSVSFEIQVGSGTKGTVSQVLDKVYVDKNSHVQLTNKDAVGQFTLSSDEETLTYTASSASDHQISVDAAAAGINDKFKWEINTLGGKDKVYFEENANATISTGAGNDTVTVGKSTAIKSGDVYVNAGDGNNEINFYSNGAGSVYAGVGNDTVNVFGSGDHIVTLGGGNNKIDASTATGDISIGGGSGKDTIKATNKAVVYGSDGEDVFDVSTTGAIIKDYTYGSDVLYVGTPTSFDFGADGTATINNTAIVDISAGTNTGDFYAVTVMDASKKKAQYAIAGENGSNIDVQSLTSNVVLVGNNNEDKGDALYSGSGKDTIYAGVNDSVFGGAGNDTIAISSSSSDSNVMVGISTSSGKDTVSGFNAKFEGGDTVYFVDGELGSGKFTYDGTSKIVTVKDGNGSLALRGISSITGGTGAVELKVNDYKYALIAEGATASISSASYADMYTGSKAKLSFAAVEDDLAINLGNNAVGNGIAFNGVNSVVGGSANTTLMGTSSADYLVAASGKTSLYGGAGKDTLEGNADSTDVFFFGEGTGTNTVVNFQATGSNNYEADTLAVLNSISGAKLTSTGVEISVSDGSKAVLNGRKADDGIKIAADNFTGVAKVGSASSANNFTFDSTVGYYGGGTGSDKISVSSGFSDNAEVWLDGSKGTVYASIDALDFKNGSGNYILAGDSSKQSIIGGKGDNSLWGGAGNAADYIEGSSAGSNVFFYGVGEGNDTIKSSSTSDRVNLYNVSLADVKSADITGSGVNITMNDGSKLTVNTGSRNIQFSLSDGSTYVANQSTKKWDNA